MPTYAVSKIWVDNLVLDGDDEQNLTSTTAAHNTHVGFYAPQA
jgi:hypothetical protein